MRPDSWLIQLTQTHLERINSMFGWAFYVPKSSPNDPRLEPVDGDEIDELVNEQLARGKAIDWR